EVCEGFPRTRSARILRGQAAPQFGVGAEGRSFGASAAVTGGRTKGSGSSPGTGDFGQHAAQGHSCRAFVAAKKNEPAGSALSSKSERSQVDSQAPMGNATTRSLERVAAAMGALESAPVQFQPTCDVTRGGVLLALPALLAVGLLHYTPEMYQFTQGILWDRQHLPLAGID